MLLKAYIYRQEKLNKKKLTKDTILNKSREQKLKQEVEFADTNVRIVSRRLFRPITIYIPIPNQSCSHALKCTVSDSHEHLPLGIPNV